MDTVPSARVPVIVCQSTTRRAIRGAQLVTVLLALPGNAAIHAQPPEPSHIFVATVFDAQSRTPVVGAFAAAVGTDRFGITDRNGSVRIDALPDGVHTIRVWRLGYEPMLFTARFDSLAVQVLDAPIMLQPLPMVLPEVVVEAERTRIVTGPLGDFYRRQREGSGWFFTRADIDARGADELRQIVRVIPGVNVEYVGGLRWTIRLADNQRVRCPVVYFVDGIQANEQMALSIKPERLDGIEVYRRATEIPPEFNVRGASCGVMVLWSRR